MLGGVRCNCRDDVKGNQDGVRPCKIIARTLFSFLKTKENHLRVLRQGVKCGLG